MGKVYKIKRGDLIFIIIVMFLLGAIFATLTVPEKIKNNYIPSAVDGEKTVTMGIPAVDADGNGVVGTLTTRIRPGTGQVLVNINNVLSQFDTQYAGRTAAKAAAKYLHTEFLNVDILYDIKVNATIIEGPSAGASMATSIILGMKNITADGKIMMTGTINETGEVGPIGAVAEKAKAARDNGATIFLVPRDQSTELTTARTRTCTTADGFQLCQIKYSHNDTNIGQSLNMTVAEVSNLTDVVSYFIRESNQTNVSI